MRMVDIIIKKRMKQELTKEEIDFFVEGYANKNTIPDYQASALTMAILLNGMNAKETSLLTDAMKHSGDVIDLSMIKGIKVDKHSTGGVGDKTSLVLGPMVASCGAPVAKMSGRGLGHTGGTLDKMESIPGMSIDLTEEQFIKQVNDIGIAIMGQTAELVPADKKLYSLRDVTGTVESLPLIASSIMSKKLATGSDAICLDVKYGSGAFCKTIDEARNLARAMVDIGTHLKKNTKAVLSNMEQPLGMAIGNILEVKEAVNTLRGNGPKDLVDLCLEIGSIMLVQSEVCKNEKEALDLLKTNLENGLAYNKLLEFISAQGGDISYLVDLSKFEVASKIIDIFAEKDGYISRMDALALGNAAMKLGAGREKKEDIIDYTAGIVLACKVGDYVHKGDKILTIHTNIDDSKINSVKEEIRNAISYCEESIFVNKLIEEIVK